MASRGRCRPKRGSGVSSSCSSGIYPFRLVALLPAIGIGFGCLGEASDDGVVRRRCILEAAICASNVSAESSIWLDSALRNGSRLPFAERSRNNDAGTRKLGERGMSALVKTGWPGE